MKEPPFHSQLIDNMPYCPACNKLCQTESGLQSHFVQKRDCARFQGTYHRRDPNIPPDLPMNIFDVSTGSSVSQVATSSLSSRGRQSTTVAALPTGNSHQWNDDISLLAEDCDDNAVVEDVLDQNPITFDQPRTIMFEEFMAGDRVPVIAAAAGTNTNGFLAQQENNNESLFNLSWMEPGIRQQLHQIHVNATPVGTHVYPRNYLPFLDLVDILDNAGAPLYVFRQVIDWAEKNSKPTKGFHPRMLPPNRSREGFIQQTRKLLGLQRHGKNFTKVVVAIDNPMHSGFVLPVPSTTTGQLVVGAVSGSNRQRRQSVMVETSHTDVNPNALSTQVNLTLYDRSSLSRPRVDTEVYVYPFIQQVQSLLDCRPIFQDTTLLLTNPSCPWLPYLHPPTSPVDDVISGTWYRDTLLDLGMSDITSFEDWVSRGKPFLLPLVLYVDKTGTDTLCRYTLEPLIFSFAIFRRQLLVQSFAWKHMGFVPDQDRMSSAQHQSQRKGKDGKGRSCRNYHRCMEVLLRDLCNIHTPHPTTGERRPIPLRMTIGQESHVVSAYLPVAFVIGDNKSNDFLCGKVANHSIKNNRVCRSCNCPTEEADNPYYQCQELSQATVDLAVQRVTEARKRNVERPSESAKEALETAEHFLGVHLHRYYLDNPFSKIWFGRSTTGIHGHTPPDVLHSARKGHIYRNLMLIMSALGKQGKELLDNQVARLLCSTRFHARDRFPRTSFPNGFSNLTKLTSQELVGCTFSLLLFLLTPKGYSLIERKLTSFVKKQREENTHGFDARLADDAGINGNEVFSDDESTDENGDRSTGNRASARVSQVGVRRSANVSVQHEVAKKINDIRELLEMELTFDAWCSHGPFWSASTSRANEIYYRQKIGAMLEKMINTLPRSDGNGWKLQKTHEILHLPANVSRFGHSRNFDSGHGESALKDKAKKPARTSQKRSYHHFQEQVCSRIDAIQVKAQVYNSMGTLPERENNILYNLRDRVREKIQKEQRLLSESTGVSILEIAYEIKMKLWTMTVFMEKTTDRNGCRVSQRFIVHDKDKADSFPPFAKRELQDWVAHEFPLDSYVVHIHAYSELARKRIEDGRLVLCKTFRAHYNYRGDGAWYDWVLSNWDIDNHPPSDGPVAPGSPPSDQGLYPGKALSFFELKIEPRHDVMQLTPLSEDAEFLLAEKHCLLHSTTKCAHDENDPFADSVLTCKYQLEYDWRTKEAVFRVVSVSTLEDHCFVIENTPGVFEQLVDRESSTVRYVHDLEKTWGSLF